MISLLKKIASRVIENDRFWTLFDTTFLNITRYAESKRKNLKDHAITDQAVQDVFPDLTVVHGPFQGMKYPQIQSIDNLFSKLIGSYERELHPILEKICNTNYTEIVDVGCAEGYYAVGLTMQIPSATMFAFDIDEKAKALCVAMAELNQVRQRIVMGTFCDAKTLTSIPFTGRGLIISDCEGYEKVLFTKDIMPFLAHYDILIEVHDLIDIEISSTLHERFKETHQITTIQSIDDITKAHTYSYDELSGYDLSTRKILLAEERSSIQEWFYITPRTA
jgi:hypothetical protein